MKKEDLSNYSWSNAIDYRKHADLYKVGRGEQGVLICEPYKSEILPFWKFKTPEDAKKSANKIYRIFQAYLKNDDFVGADMARKYLQMGFTRAKRYANYKGGRKYEKDSKELLQKGTGDNLKNISATIFYKKWQKAEKNIKYRKLKKAWKDQYG